MFAQFGMPGVFEILIVFACAAPVILAFILVYRLVIRPQQGKAGLVPCPDCGRQVSPRAQSCPNCGAPLKPQG